MTTSPEIHYQQWGDGPPVLALHGLGLESTAYTGIAGQLNDLGLQMLAADLPGFGLTPAPGRALSAAALAEPVIELAKRLDTKPLVMGMSLGARVALEVALQEPNLFRGVVMVAPPLPRRSKRWALLPARLLSPGIAQRIPVEKAWPLLKRQADRLENELTGEAQHDWFLRTSKRMIYFVSCPATRWALISATRELALDPAYGPDGVWTRLDQLEIPAAFIWGGKDKFVGNKEAPFVEEHVPHAFQIHVPCIGHFNNGPHFRCMDAATIEAIGLVDNRDRRRRRATKRTRRREIACLVGDDTPDIGDEPPTPDLEVLTPCQGDIA